MPLENLNVSQIKGNKIMKCDMSCKEKFDSALKLIFVVVFTYGVMSAVCCMKSCSSSGSAGFSCCKSTATNAPVKQCGANCQKPCCAK